MFTNMINRDTHKICLKFYCTKIIKHIITITYYSVKNIMTGSYLIAEK